MTGRVLTPNEIAERIRMTAAYIRQLCDRGELPARKVGKFWRIEESDFDAWWAKEKTKPVSDEKVIAIAERRVR